MITAKYTINLKKKSEKKFFILAIVLFFSKISSVVDIYFNCKIIRMKNETLPL